MAAALDMKRMVLGMILVLFLPFEVGAEKITLGPFRTLDSGDYAVTFESSRISEDQMKKLVLISPYLSSYYKGKTLVFSPSLELCVDDDPAYLDCGTRNIRAPNFYKNAQVNLKAGRQALQFLEGLEYPEELELVVSYLRRSLSFSLWLEETRYEFYESSNADILKRKWGDIDPLMVCTATLKEIENATSQLQKYNLAKYKWHSCLNNVFRERLGQYPLESWNQFITTYGIEEWPYVERLLRRAKQYEDEKEYDMAISLYKRIATEYPNDMHEDGIQSVKYSDLSRDRIHVLTCRERRGLDASTDTPKEIASLVKAAWVESDKEKLTTLASCDFKVGPVESDNIFSIMPERVVTVLFQELRNRDLQIGNPKEVFESLWMLAVYNTSNTERHEFLFQRIGDKWIWTAFATSSNSILRALHSANQLSNQ
ncbi:MAG: hypothetical protein ACE5G5_00970 [Candidatus Methylomirabilales bacterium]